MHYSENDFYTSDQWECNGRRACKVTYKATSEYFVIFEKDEPNNNYSYAYDTPAPTAPQLREAVEKAADTYFSTHK